jgi:hypothetical protein
MKTTSAAVILSLAVDLALAASPSAAVAPKKKLPPKPVSALVARTMSAPGQQEYTCEFTGLNKCKAMEVQVWLIPNLPSLGGGYAGCVAAFPYKSLSLPSELPASVDAFDLVWTLVAPVAGFEYQFAGTGTGVNRGIEVKSLDDVLFGKVSNLLTLNSQSATQFVWSVNVKTYSKFVGNHQPNVEYRPLGTNDWIPCVPVDPIITNNAS